MHEVTHYKSDEVLDFGKYEGNALIEVFKIDPDYIDWTIRARPDFYIDERVIDELKKVNPSFTFSDHALTNLKEKLCNKKEKTGVYRRKYTFTYTRDDGFETLIYKAVFFNLEKNEEFNAICSQSQYDKLKENDGIIYICLRSLKSGSDRTYYYGYRLMGDINICG